MANTKVTSRVLADNAVLTANINDDAVTTAKIADDVALGGNPTTTTQSAGNNTTRIATTAFVTTAVANIVDSAPSALDTLNELAAALGDDANFSTTVTNSIAGKVALSGSGQTIADSGNLTLDVAGEINLDADGGKVRLKDAGTEIGRIVLDNNQDLEIVSSVNDKDLKLRGQDNGSTITALTLDMSDAGKANFNSSLSVSNDSSRTLSGVSGNHGTMQLNGSGAGGYEGLSIDARVVLMTDGGSIAGLYNDVDGEWLFRADLNGATNLYHDGSAKLTTSSTGISITGVTVCSDKITHGNGELDLYDGSSNTVLKNGVTNGNVKLQTIVSGVGAANTLIAGDGALGQVDMPYQSSFHAYSPAVTNGGGNIIIFGSTYHNTGSDYDTSNGRYTAPRTGRYLFTASVLMNPNSTTSYERILFATNANAGSTTYGDTLTIPGTTNYDSLNLSVVLSLGAGDYVTVQNAGESPTYGTSYGAFTGHYLG